MAPWDGIDELKQRRLLHQSAARALIARAFNGAIVACVQASDFGRPLEVVEDGEDFLVMRAGDSRRAVRFSRTGDQVSAHAYGFTPAELGPTGPALTVRLSLVASDDIEAALKDAEELAQRWVHRAVQLLCRKGDIQ